MSDDDTIVLQVAGVIAGYRPDLPILHGVSVVVHSGEIVTIIGPNGAGKSTLIKAVAGLVAMSAGQVLLRGANITQLPAHERPAAGIGYVPQTANVFTSLSVHENLVLGAVSLSAQLARARIDEIYALYPMLAERRREKAAVLSGGQRQMLAIARALLPRPTLLLLDEPTAGLSPLAARDLLNMIRELANTGASVLMVEQNAKAALGWSDRGYIFAEGENRLDGPASLLLADKRVAEIFLGTRHIGSTLGV